MGECKRAAQEPRFSLHYWNLCPKKIILWTKHSRYWEWDVDFSFSYLIDSVLVLVSWCLCSLCVILNDTNKSSYIKYTHFFSPWMDSLFNLDYSEPLGTNLDQSWLFRTISRPFLFYLGCFLTCFWGQTPIFSWVTPAFGIEIGLRSIIWNYLGQFGLIGIIFGQFLANWDILWPLRVVLNPCAIHLGLT